MVIWLSDSNCSWLGPKKVDPVRDSAKARAEPILGIRLSLSQLAKKKATVQLSLACCPI